MSDKGIIVSPGLRAIERGVIRRAVRDGRCDDCNSGQELIWRQTKASLRPPSALSRVIIGEHHSRNSEGRAWQCWMKGGMPVTSTRHAAQRITWG